jgi:UDP-galactopyranose mutase
MTGQKSKYTTILKEIPCFGGIEYYPYWTKEYIDLANKYRELAKLEKNTYFLGRLGEYRYYDMDDAIRSALNLFQVIKETSGE